jgi:hypothetical protein
LIAAALLGLVERFMRPVAIVGILALIGVLIHWDGHRAGYAARSAEIDAARTEQAVGQVHQLRQNIADARAEDQRLIAKLTAQNTEQRALAAQLRARLAAQANLPLTERYDQASRPLLGQCVLDPESVRLLDQARAAPAAGVASGSAGGADAQVGAAAPAAPAVTGGEFAENDLEVVRLYKELAARHDGLVDWVNSKLNTRP